MGGRIWMWGGVLAVARAGCGSDDNASEGGPDGGFSNGAGGSRGDTGSDAGPGVGPGSGDPGTGGGSGGSGGTTPVGGDGQGGGGTHGAGQLTAGEWRDLDHWDFWRGLVGGVWQPHERYWGFDTSARFPVIVHDAGAPVGDAEVELLDVQGTAIWRARTDAWGEVELFAGLFSQSEGPYTVRAHAGSASAERADLEGPPALRIDLELAGAAAPAPVLDVAFLVDTTGSMGDELHYLQTELGDVIERVRTNYGQQTIRVGLGFYRDTGDMYEVRDFPFTTDVDLAVRNLAAQDAGGGGDWPEAVERGLDRMITQGQWSDSARARILFLVLDAPPHYRPEVVEKMKLLTARAAELGVRIVPLAASGVDENTEALLRLLGIATGGTYTFLTDHSGIGNPHLEPTIGEYQVELLNDLLVRVIGEALGE